MVSARAQPEVGEKQEIHKSRPGKNSSAHPSLLTSLVILQYLSGASGFPFQVFLPLLDRKSLLSCYLSTAIAMATGLLERETWGPLWKGETSRDSG